MNEKKEYIIPRRITTRFEIFPGWGWSEIIILLLGFAIGGVLYLLFHAIGLSPSIQLSFPLFPPLLAFLATRPSPVSGDNFITQAKSIANYVKNPKIYVYDYDAFKDIDEKSI